jgi:hypothetical protein
MLLILLSLLPRVGRKQAPQGAPDRREREPAHGAVERQRIVERRA